MFFAFWSRFVRVWLKVFESVKKDPKQFMRKRFSTKKWEKLSFWLSLLCAVWGLNFFGWIFLHCFKRVQNQHKILRYPFKCDLEFYFAPISRSKSLCIFQREGVRYCAAYTVERRQNKLTEQSSWTLDSLVLYPSNLLACTIKVCTPFIFIVMSWNLVSCIRRTSKVPAV